MMLFLLSCVFQAVQGSTIALEPDFDLVSFTPKDGSTLSGREALTAVFTLAVIPLGADLGDGPLPEDYVPFVLEGADVPGHLRWVSSSTARFDPSIDWPSDLKDLSIHFNSRIRSVSGKSLRKVPAVRHFSTAPLTYWVRDVKSKTLETLTDNCWSSSLEEDRFQPKNAHECPFDAKVLVSFNFPVVVDRFVKDPAMFELTEGGLIFTHTFPISAVAACPEEAPKPLQLDLGGPVVVNQSRCLEVSLPKRLETGGDYKLKLRKGARYHVFAGPYGGDDSDSIKLTGLRPFRLNFLKRDYRKELFRIYLRHGLKAPNSSLPRLQHSFRVTNVVDGQVLPHQVTLKSKSTLQLKVEGLQPEEEYVLSVSAADSVIDGMNLPLEASKGRLKMGNLPGVFLAPQPPNPGLWTSTTADRFLPKDFPEAFPLLQRKPPPDLWSSKVDPDASMQAFVCSITSTNELGDFLTFFFQPQKDTSIAGPCSKRSFQAHPGVILAAGKTNVRFNEIPLNFPKSRLLFVELTCVGQHLGSHCASERLARQTRARFLNAASFSAVAAFAKPSSSPYAALGELRRTTILVSVHNLFDETPAAGLEVEIWEIPSTNWFGGRSIQPPAKRIATGSTDSHGRALFLLPEEEALGKHLRDSKGFVAVIVNPKSGEMLLGDLLRLPPSPAIPSESQALAASLRLYVTTDRAVYAPGDALALMGVIAAIGADCAGKKPGNMCAPAELHTAGASPCLPGLCIPSAILAEIVWKLQTRPGQQEVCSLYLWPVSPMGMFAANITVPENASLGRVPAVSIFYAKELAQVPTSCSEWRQQQPQLELPSVSVQGTPFLDILIADPRPPSAVLTLGTPEFLLPGQPLKVNATLKTYTGIPLQNHELQVELTKPGKGADHQPMPFFGDTPGTFSSSSKDSGTLSSDLVGETDAFGAWSKELHFGGDVPWVPKLEDEVTFKVKARGPTGEMLTQSKKLPVRVGPWDIELRTSTDTHNADGPLPGQEFAVWTALKEKYPPQGWKVVEDKAAQLFLVDANQEVTRSCQDWLRAKEKVETLTPQVDPHVRSCEQGLGPKSPALCYFRLPPTGRFAVVAKVRMQDDRLEDHVVSTCTFVGRTAKQWRQSPLNSPNIFKRFEVRPTAAYYFPGDTVKLQVWNPLSVRTRMLVIWGDRPAVTELTNVSAQETVDLGVLQDADCPMTSCKVDVFLWSVGETAALIKDLPLSIHYPEGAPLWAHQEVELRIERPGQMLKVELKPEAKVIKPGGSVEIEVDIQQEEGAQTELSMLVVDKAWLDMRPLELKEPTKAFEPEKLVANGPQWRLASTLDGLATGTSVMKATQRIRQSFKDNPWIDYISWPLSLRGSDDSMLDDEHYMDKWAEDLTDFPNPPMVAMDAFAEGANFGGPLMMAKGLAPMALMAKSAPVPEMAVAADAPVAMDEAASAASSPESPKATLRKRFAKLVALNRALLEPGINTWKAHIRLPEDLSTYTVRVLAVSRKGGNWSWGVAEATVGTSQQVYGKPLLPRMLRFGDVCRIGAAIQANSGESPRPLLVEAMDLHNIRLLDQDKQAITMIGTSAEVRFTFAADLALGSASVIFRIKDESGEILDMVEATIEVEEQQQGLSMASTTSIQAVADKAVVRKEAIAALKAVPGYGEMTLSASVGFQAPLLDAVMEFAPTPADQPWQPQGETLLAILLGGHVLHVGYRMEASHEGLAAAISAAQDRLAGQVVLQPLLGFVSAPPEQRQWQGRQTPDLLSNAYALLVLRVAESVGGAPAAWAPLDRERLIAAAQEAIRLRKEAWRRCCADRISLSSFIGTSQLAVFFLAVPEAQSRLQALWEEIQREAIKGPEGAELDLLIRLASGQLGTGLVMNFGADRRAEGAGAALLDRIRVQGPTAYFAHSAESMHAASTWVQALALWLWAGGKYAHHPFAPLVASHLLAGERCPWQQHLPARDMILASIALFAFDTATGSAWSANIPLQIVAAPAHKKLLQATLSSTPKRLLSSRTAWPWDELPRELATSGLDLDIEVGPGSGLAVVSYGLKFMPLMPFLEPQFRGILVQKIVQRTENLHPGRCTGKPVTAAFPGETLCVTIQITSPDDLQDVVVIDMVPAGLEPIDEALAESTDEMAGGLMRRGLFFGRSWDREIHHDFVRWRSGFLWAGTHSLSFTCLANAPGLYSMPAAKAYSEKNAEVMGLSGAASFLVEETSSTSNAVSAVQLREYRASVWMALKVNFTEIANPAVAAPIACPKACPPAGSCNVAKGRCECASSSGEMLPCEKVSVDVKAPFSQFLGKTQGNRHRQDFMPPNGGHDFPQLRQETPKANMPSVQLVIIGLLVALLAAAVYSYIAKMKMPRNLSQAETELGSQPFRAMTDSAVRRREQPHREHTGLVQAEAEAAE